jgi:hypothetical protein
MVRTWVWGLLVVGGVAVAALAQEAGAVKRKRKPTDVNVVASVPLEVIAGAQPLDVNVVNGSGGPAANATVTVNDLNGATVSAAIRSSHVIDCSGYRDVTVFVSMDSSGIYGAFHIEWGCEGIWTEGVATQLSSPAQFTSQVLGPSMRIFVAPNGTMTNLKCVVYLRR